MRRTHRTPPVNRSVRRLQQQRRRYFATPGADQDGPVVAPVKVALIRDPSVPAGQPAPCYLNCPCGARPLAPADFTVTCRCGVTYDAAGYVVPGGR